MPLCPNKRIHFAIGKSAPFLALSFYRSIRCEMKSAHNQLSLPLMKYWFRYFQLSYFECQTKMDNACNALEVFKWIQAFDMFSFGVCACVFVCVCAAWKFFILSQHECSLLNSIQKGLEKANKLRSHFNWVETTKFLHKSNASIIQIRSKWKLTFYISLIADSFPDIFHMKYALFTTKSQNKKKEKNFFFWRIITFLLILFKILMLYTLFHLSFFVCVLILCIIVN